MKKLNRVIMAAFVMVFLASCGPSDYKQFIGTWGVERIEYWQYNIDYAGNPIAASYEMDTFYDYDVNNPNHGIQLVFKSDKSGSYRDFAIDSIWFKWNETDGQYDVYLAPPTTGYDSVIYCPDTVLVTNFSYSYDEDAQVLYMNMDYLRTFMMNIIDLTSNTFVSENRYSLDQAAHLERLERFYMKRVSDSSKSSRSGSKSRHTPAPRMSQELFNVQH